MKKETRAKLICRKEMSNGKIDMFEVIVLVTEKADKKKEAQKEETKRYQRKY